ncbi:MAG: bifunctional transcriptional activator/DNA repair enzyme AdaA [Candidatus Omnitrophota bacterium]
MNEVTPYARIETAIRYLKENYRQQPSLEEVARQVRLSKFHFQRMFEDWAGVSPKAFVQYLTIEHAKRLLKEGQSTLDTAYDVGLSGPGRLHDLFVKIEAMSPGQFKNKGKDTRIQYGFYPSPFGEFLLAETCKGICHLSFVTNRTGALKELKARWTLARLAEEPGNQAKTVQAFFNQQVIPGQPIRLQIRGTDFQIKVWEALLKIPRGQLVSYSHIAAMAGNPRAARAAGSAIGKNPVAYIIPCHRVIKETGETGGYRWGADRKSVINGWESAFSERNAS